MSTNVPTFDKFLESQGLTGIDKYDAYNLMNTHSKISEKAAEAGIVELKLSVYAKSGSGREGIMTLFVGSDWSTSEKPWESSEPPVAGKMWKDTDIDEIIVDWDRKEITIVKPYDKMREAY